MVAPIVLAAGISAASQMASGYMSAQSAWKKQKKMFEWQKAWEREKMQNSYQWTVEDLKKAGLNPALGYTQGATSSGGAPNPSTPNFNYGDPGESISSAINLVNSTKLNDSQVDLNETTSAKNEADTAGVILNNELVKKYGDKEKLSQIANNLASVGKQQSESAKAIAEKEKTEQETKNIKAGIGSKIFGTDADTSDTLMNLGSLVFGGLGAGGAIKAGTNAYKAYKASKGFGKFLKAM